MHSPVWPGKWLIETTGETGADAEPGKESSPVQTSPAQLMELLTEVFASPELCQARQRSPRFSDPLGHIILTGKNPPEIRFYELSGAPSPTSDAVAPLFPPFPVLPELHDVMLTTPAPGTDKRWRSIALTTAALYLGSALTASGFSVRWQKTTLPTQENIAIPTGAGVIGLTLFEDVMPETAELTKKISATFSGVLAAGGPMITLHPLESARHLPELNLLIRGEAETIFPAILEALAQKDFRRLFQFKGIMFRMPGVWLISELDHVNHPDLLHPAPWRLEFLEKAQIEAGLELNLSRGCRRGCVFCSHVQGRKFRTLPPTEAGKLLDAWEKRAESLGVSHPAARTININDDDILQDPDYAREIFQLIRSRGFRLWGVQTSIASLFPDQKTLRADIMALLAQKDIYVGDRPLIWVGTDVFLKERGKRMGKWTPPERLLREMAEMAEELGVRHYHYWISSDHGSSWSELAQEYILLADLLSRHSHMGLLPHAPFTVPYPGTPLHTMLTASPKTSALIEYRRILDSPVPELRLPLVKRVKTSYPALNRFLDSPHSDHGWGFFGLLKQNEWLKAAIALYESLKQERLTFESVGNPEVPLLREWEKRLEDFIAEKM